MQLVTFFKTLMNTLAKLWQFVKLIFVPHIPWPQASSQHKKLHIFHRAQRNVCHYDSLVLGGGAKFANVRELGMQTGHDVAPQVL